MPRRPSRIMTSPGRTGWPVLCSTSPRSSQSRMVRAIARATRRSGSSPIRGAPGSGQGSPAGSASAGRASGHSSTRPGSLARSVSWCRIRPGSTTPPCASGSANTASTIASTAGTDRNDRSSSSAWIGRPAAAARAVRRSRTRAEVGEVGTLEAVDRLLLVADHEQGSRDRRARRHRRRTPRSA